MRRAIRYGISLTATALVVLAAGSLAAQTVETAFVGEIQLLADRAEELLNDAETVNLNWENRDIGFQQALGELRAIEADSNDLLAAAQALDAPTSMLADRDQIIAAAVEISTSASAMVAGLRADDNGEARQAALAAYGAAVVNFSTLVAQIAEAATPTTTTTLPPETTTTEVPATTTTALPTTTTATTIALTTIPVEENGSGAPWPLVPIALAGGLLVGMFGGLVLGRQARVKLLDALRAAREQAGGPPPT